MDELNEPYVANPGQSLKSTLPAIYLYISTIYENVFLCKGPVRNIRIQKTLKDTHINNVNEKSF